MTLDPIDVGIIVSIGLLVMVFLGMRVAFAAGLAGLVGLVWLIGWDAGLGIAGTIPHSKAVSYTLSVLPLFVVIGYLAFHAGITTGAFRAARAWVGHLPGGLAVASVFAAAGFAAVSGASTATAAVFSRVAIPEMLARGYDRRLAGGVVAVGGTLAALIPPSGMLVIYAIMVEESVGRLILAAFIPGLLSALSYAVIVVVWCKINPALGAPLPAASWRERFASLPGTFPIALVIAILFSAVFFGWATPTEAAALGAFLVFVMAVLKRTPWRSLGEAMMETAKLTAMVFTVIWGVLIYVRFLGFAGLPEAVSETLTGLDLPRWGVMLIILGIYVVLGMFMDAIGMMLLTLPVVFPTVVALGYDPVWFGIVVVKMAEVCLITPPIGLNCFVVAGVQRDIPLGTVFKGVLPFLVADAVTIGLFLAVPEIVTWLPDAMR